MSILEISGLSKRFGGLRAVNEVDFGVAKGEILGLIGPNGSGKSTTLSLIMGIVRPDAGSIRLDGREVAGWPTHRVAEHGIGMVFQHSRPLHRQTVLENIKLALLPNTIFQLFPRPEVARQAQEIAERVGLGDVINHYPDALAYADLRRLEVAKAIALDPTVVLLDEPFAGLAPNEVREFSSLVTALRDQDHAIVLVDHNVKAVASLVDRVVAMYVGEKIAEGTPAEVTGNARVREVYFGGSLDEAHPTTEQIKQALHVEDQTTAETRRQAPVLLEVGIDSVRYGKAQALRDTRIQVHEGEFVSVVGLNGAGKSTLFKSIMGFVGYDGDIAWRGESIKGRTTAAIATSGLALCPETRELFRYMSVRENLEMGGQRLDKRGLRDSLMRVFELFPVLAERQRQPALTLSGGEQQQLTIGRALMQNPRLLILDEPTLGLAPLIIENISRALERLRAETGLAILLGEQNVTFALQHSDHMYLLETGDLNWQGSAEVFVEEAGADFL